MEINNTLDILQPISYESLNLTMNFLKNSLPTSISGYNFLYFYAKFKSPLMRNSDTSDNLKNTIYIPRNCDPKNCTFISISGSNTIFLYTLDASGTDLIKCLKETKRIDWNQRPIDIVMEDQYFDKINKILCDKKTDWEYCPPEKLFYMPKELCTNFNINECPQGTYLAPIQIEHSELINYKWPYKFNGSLSFIKSLINAASGTGLFKSGTNELISWCLTNNFFCLGFWHTVDSERRKGYGNIVYKSECMRIAKNYCVDLLAHVVEGNLISEYALKKMGYQCVGILRWIERK